MKKLLYIFLFCPIITFAQNSKGIVLSGNNEPIANVNIFSVSNKIGTITNEKGEFSTTSFSNLKADEELEFSHIGYKTVKFSMRYLSKKKFKINLEESIQNLQEVTITSSKLKTNLSFKILAPLKSAVFSFGSFLKDDKIYVSGGDAYIEVDFLEKNRAEKAGYEITDYLVDPYSVSKKKYYEKHLSIYNIKTNIWEEFNLRLKPRGYHNLHYYNNSIYILGGKRIKQNSKSSWEYLEDQIEVVDLENQTIKLDDTNPHQAVDFASFTYEDNIIIMGGSLKKAENEKKDFTNKVHLYNITSGNWYELANMPTAKETTGILVGSKIYLIGGDDGETISKIETFDLITEKWQTEGELFSGLERPSITYHDAIIYFFEDQKMYTYDIPTKQLNEYDIDIELKYSALHYNDNKLYLLGGRFDNSYSKTPSSKVFSIDLEEFKNTKPIKTKTLSQGVAAVKAN